MTFGNLAKFIIFSNMFCVCFFLGILMVSGIVFSEYCLFLVLFFLILFLFDFCSSLISVDVLGFYIFRT